MVESAAILCCPQCGSDKLYHDGLRYLRDGSSLQRWLCRCCGFRFSESFLKTGEKLNITKQTGAFQPCSDLAKDSVRHRDLAADKLLDNGSFSFGEDVESHTVTVVGKGLNKLRSYSCKRQVCVSRGEAKNLAATETKTVAGEIETTQQDIKGSLTVYAAKQLTMGLTEETIQRRIQALEQLGKLGANLFNPTSVWKAIDIATRLDHEEKRTWTDGSKALAAQAYLSFCKIMRIAVPEDLNFHKWKAQSKIPWIPLETEVDQLIAACRLRMAAFLLLLKECGCRSGEAWRLKWKDIDAEHGIVTINSPEKNGLPRQHKVSSKLVAMLNSLPKTNEKIWNGNIHTWRSSFVGQRNRIAVKLQNPRIKNIHFHSLRHFFATILYHKTLNLLEVQQKLGHRNINSTVCYTHLVNFDSDEYLHAHAKTLQEEDALLDAGYEFVRYSEKDQVAIYRKRK